MIAIKSHIKTHHDGSQSAFSRAVGVDRQQVTKWISRGFIVTSDGWIINPKNHKRVANDRD